MQHTPQDAAKQALEAAARARRAAFGHDEPALRPEARAELLNEVSRHFDQRGSRRADAIAPERPGWIPAFWSIFGLATAVLAIAFFISRSQLDQSRSAAPPLAQSATSPGAGKDFGDGQSADAIAARQLETPPAQDPLTSTRRAREARSEAMPQEAMDQAAARNLGFGDKSDLDESPSLATATTAPPMPEEAPIAREILASFEVQQVGQELQIIDEDGSVYSGNIGFRSELQVSTGARPGETRPRVAEEEASRGAPVAAAKAAPSSPAVTAAPPTSQVAFRAEGTNRTLNKQVVFEGELVLPPPTTSGQVAGKKKNQRFLNSLGRQATQSGISAGRESKDTEGGERSVAASGGAADERDALLREKVASAPMAAAPDPVGAMYKSGVVTQTAPGPLDQPLRVLGRARVNGGIAFPVDATPAGSDAPPAARPTD